MTIYLSNRDGNGKTSEEGHYRFQNSAYKGMTIESTSLQVTQNYTANMSILIAPGNFKIDDSTYSYTGWNNSSYNLVVPTADTANPRITSIVLYVDKNASTSASPPNNPGIIKAIAVNGTPAASPAAPTNSAIQSAVGTGNPFIVIANITVAANATQIVSANITDTRVQAYVSDGLVNSTSIKDGAVNTSELASSSVTTTKISDGAITGDKMNAGFFGSSYVNRSLSTAYYNSSKYPVYIVFLGSSSGASGGYMVKIFADPGNVWPNTGLVGQQMLWEATATLICPPGWSWRAEKENNVSLILLREYKLFQ